ncbi:MAG: YdjY domain-containing protein, partial [Planctomycetota bacterium]
MKRLSLVVLPAAVLTATFCVGAGELRGAGVLPAGGNGGDRPAPPKDKNIARIGKVYWHKKERRLEVSGKVCLDSGPLEFLAVLKGGKEYESVLSFDCSAIDLNVAMIGAGYKAAGGVKKIGDPEVPKGDPVYLYVEWK